ncbi:hypothetical protein D3C77_386740 [compost metagenome]
MILHTRLSNRPVHIPFNKLNLVIMKKIGHKIQNELLHFRLGYVQQQLITQLCSVPCREMVHPIRMLSVQFTIRIHGLRLHPNSEFHAKLMNPIN